MNRTLQDQALAIAATARLQALAAARREIETLRNEIVDRLDALSASLADDSIDLDVSRDIEQLCETADTAARSAADDIRVELQLAYEQLRAYETRPAPRAPVADTACATLDQLAVALGALATPTAGPQLLTTVAEVFSAYFGRVIVGAAEPEGFTVWHSRGFDPPLHRKTILRAPHDSPLARATAAWGPASSNTPIGIVGAATRYAIALPLVAKGRGNAMVYAENPPTAELDDQLAGRIAEILAQSIRPRLHIKAPPPASAEPPKQRRARRVKMSDGTTVVVDQGEGTLVDLSTLGAQVLSPYAIHPNSSVRLLLPHDAGGLACAAKVVWVIVEQKPGTQAAVYRAGVQFTDVKAGELEGYMEFFDSGIKH